MRPAEDLQQEVDRLRCQLAEAQEAVRALIAGEVDAVAAPESGTVLLAAAQRALRRSERQLRAVFEGALDAMLIADDQARYVAANPAAAELLGLPVDAILGRTVADFSEPGTGVGAAWQAFLREGTQAGEFVLVRPDGERRHVDFAARANVLPGRHLSVLRDVTERKRAEERFTGLFGAIPLPVCITRTRDQRIVEVNPSFLEAVGATREETIGRTTLELGLWPDPVDREALLTRLARDRRVHGYEARVRGPGGEERHVLLSIEAIEMDGEDCRLTVLTDVTERVRAVEARLGAEARLRDSEARFRGLLDSGILGVCAWAPDHTVLHANEAFLEMLDWPVKELSSVRWEPADEPARGRALAELGAKGRCRPFETTLKRRDGSSVPVVLGAVRNGDGTGIAFALDLTDQVQAQRALTATSELLEALVAASPAAILVLDQESRVRLWNPAAERIFGWDGDQIRGAPCPVSAVCCSDLDVAFAGRLVRTSTPDGRAISLSVSGGPLRREDGSLDGAVRILVDTTEQVSLEEQLRQSQKMDAIGRLAGGVAHDFNNLLVVIGTTAAMALDALPPGHEVRADIQQIVLASDQAAVLTRQLLAFSRKQTLQPQVVSLNETVSGMGELLRRLLGSRIQLEVALDPRVAPVKVDAGQIEQVLLNLVVNARDASREGGRVLLRTEHVVVDGPQPAEHPGVPPGRWTVLAVADEGVGIPQDLIPHIFEPFWTTKEKGRGTGLGLSTVYGIVRQSGGVARVSSEPGEGSTFRIYLPPAVSPVATPQAAPARELEPSPSSRRVLVVEDEPLVRRVARQVLERAGYVVLEAADPDQAIALCREHEHRIDLLLTDVIMPRLRGDELADELRAMRPDLRVLLMSGYTDGLAPGREDPLLPKPFSPEALLEAVRQALTSNR